MLPLLALLVPLGQGHAQATPGEESAVEWIQPEDVPARADALLRRLDAAAPDAAATSALETIKTSLPQLEGDLDAVLQRASNALGRAAAPSELEDIRGELTSVAAPLGGWKDELATEAKRVARVLESIVRDRRVWSETRGRPETAAAGDVVVRRVESSIEALNETAANLRKWRVRVLAINDRVIDRAAIVDTALQKLQTTTVAERANLFVPDRAPLWSRGLGGEMWSELPHVPEAVRAYARSTHEYLERDPRPLIVQALMGLLLMVALGRFSSRARERLAGDDVAARAVRLLERPYAVGLLIALMASPVFHPLAPRRFTQLVAIIALFPAARIVVHVSEQANLSLFVGLLGLLVLDRLGLAVASLAALARAIFLVSLAYGLGLALWASRRLRFQGAAPWMRRAARLAVAGLALAMLAEIGGWTYLATILGRGILAGALVGLYVYAAGLALAALVAYALASRTFRRSHIVGRNAALLQRGAERGVRWLGLGIWLYFVALALGVRGTAANFLSALLDAGVSVGALSLSVGAVLAFVLTFLGALVLARIVTGVLEGDVYPRIHMPRGVPYALSTLVRYGVYSIGFLFALAAAGVQLSQVAIMFGGLGIGIGLGLQDLVKNFAAGLTLLLERRVHVGDTLEMPGHGTLGRVLSIGMRASVIRALNGAEVVVPNADLISTAVTNFTLSDRLYRIEVPVGVAYGTDPARVVALLLEAVRSNDQLLAEPAPQALFKGFGDSSLDFVVRAWIDQGYESALPLTSSLALAVHSTLNEAGVVIPFPQRDLHLASVSPVAGAALSGVGRTDRSEPGSSE